VLHSLIYIFYRIHNSVVALGLILLLPHFAECKIRTTYNLRNIPHQDFRKIDVTEILHSAFCKIHFPYSKWPRETPVKLQFSIVNYFSHCEINFAGVRR